MIVCNECGNTTKADNVFCRACGALLEWSGQRVGSGPTSASPARPPRARMPVEEVRRPPPVRLAAQPVFTGPYCSSCGVRNAEGRVFCRSCGETLRVAVRPQPAPAARSWWRRLADWLRGRPAAPAARRPQGHDVRLSPASAAPGRGRVGPAPQSCAVPAGHAAKLNGSRHDIGGQLHRVSRPRRIALGRLAPLFLVAGLIGVGLGPARSWITTHVFKLGQNTITDLHQHYVTVSPVGATASSWAPAHNAGLAIDGIQQTYWLTSLTSGGSGVGATLTIRFSVPQTIDSVGLLSGEPGGAYLSQSRPQTLELTAPGNAPVSLSFDDTANFQARTVSLRGVKMLTVTIKAAYAGQKGQAVAIREIEFFNRV